MKPYLNYLAIIFLFINSISVTAQKLPKVQEVSIRAPKDVKTDGKQTEWGSQLQAYNNSTQVYYIMANDDEKLYLVVQATDPLVIRKAIAGGITLTINSNKEMDYNKPIAITYPLFDQRNWPVIGLKDKAAILKDQLNADKRLDSFRVAANQQLSKYSKEIKVTGAKGIEDTLVSVYNDEGIKAVGLFDHQLTYTYELVIPLKYLDLSFKGQQQFRYNIKLNGSSFAEGNFIEDIEGGTRVTRIGTTQISIPDMQFIRYPTDFIGKYTLAKK